jgi:FAD/FMN-containing dehydrogenase
MNPSKRTRGGTYWRGQPEYEATRQASARNLRLPDRYPDVIVQANDVYDVVAAVKLAQQKDLRISVRSGGHSWAVNHLRDGGLLLDVSRLNDVHVDKATMRAICGPGCKGNELAGRLGKAGLFFPTGHCEGVCLGGYLLQGGFGWHSRVLGPACMSVAAIDLVTADGTILHASPDENADLYWAARGAGPGFFGVVTRYHLRLYPRPKATGVAVQNYPIAMLEEVFRWAHAVGPEVPGAVELLITVTQHVPGIKGPGIVVSAPVFTDSWREALAALAFMNKSALERKAAFRLPFAPVGLRLLYRGAMTHYPAGHRYAVDNMWTSAGIEDLLPGVRRIAETLPGEHAHMLWMNWAPPPDRPDMAFSVEDDIYIALYSVWKEAKDDARFSTWPVERMREMQHLATGCQLADENLGQRPARFVADDHLARLDQIRATRDPEQRFYPWMGRPTTAAP